MKYKHAASPCIGMALHRAMNFFLHQNKIWLLLLPVCCSSCFRHFFSSRSGNKTDSVMLLNLMESRKHFVLHDINTRRDFALSGLKITNETLEAEAVPLDSPRFNFYEHPPKPKGNFYPSRFKNVPLEVHMYARCNGPDNTHLRIPISGVQRIDVYEPDRRSTTRSTIGSVVSLTLTTAGIVAIIAAISESESDNSRPSTGTGSTVTCSPQIYLVENGREEPQGTLYSGAIAASLQRTDYMPVTVDGDRDSKPRFSIRGTEDDRIMLDRVQLVQVTHGANEKVLPDRHGRFFSYADAVQPEKTSAGDKMLRTNLLSRDGRYYPFTQRGAGGGSSELVLRFARPRGARSGRLIIAAKNSAWSYYLFNQFKSLYGRSYADLIAKKDKADPGSVLRCELDQYLPLLVSVKSKTGWKFIDYFPTIGIAGPREMIMNLDLAEGEDANYVEVKLETTYMFWDLDYAGMDFTERPTPASDIFFAARSQLVSEDAPSKQVTPGEPVTITATQRLDLDFDLPVCADKGRRKSFFLEGTGYYHDRNHYDGQPKIFEIGRFSGKGAFELYSREKFDLLVKAMH